MKTDARSPEPTLVGQLGVVRTRQLTTELFVEPVHHAPRLSDAEAREQALDTQMILLIDHYTDGITTRKMDRRTPRRTALFLPEQVFRHQAPFEQNSTRACRHVRHLEQCPTR